MNKIIRFSVPALSTLIGICGGITIERTRNSNVLNVSAAIPLPNKFTNIDSVERLDIVMKHGYPSSDTIRKMNDFVLSYDRRNRTANWVFEHLTSSSLQKDDKVNRSKCEFFEDKTIHPLFRPTNNDYLKSGYDRGHLAAAGNHRSSQENVNETFVLSNICPQVGKGFNRGVWNKLEKYVRYRARKAKNLWVCTGPLYLPRISSNGKKYVSYEVIGPNDVSVPTHFFKVFVVEDYDGSFELEAYVIENKSIDENIPLRAFQVPVNSIERAAGFLLFDKIPRNSFKQINGDNIWLKQFEESKPLRI